MNLDGRTALLSGASKGLGRELALTLDAKGCRLLLVARNAEKLYRLRDALQTTDSRIFVCDLSDAAERGRLIEEIKEQEGRLDLIVNNAGLGSHSRLDQLSGEEVQQLLQLNTVAPLELTAELLPLFPVNLPGGVVNIGSVAGEMITPGMSLYSASKHALHAFSRAIDIELREAGHFSLLVILGAIRETSFGVGIRHPIEGQPQWYRRLDVDAADAAERIVRAIEKEQERLVIPGWYRPVFTAGRLLGPITRWAAQQAYRKTRR